MCPKNKKTKKPTQLFNRIKFSIFFNILTFLFISYDSTKRNLEGREYREERQTHEVLLHHLGSSPSASGAWTLEPPESLHTVMCVNN